jgi:PKD repeat protein
MVDSTSTVASTSVVASTTVVADVPALDWSYGCSATSAGMYFGYYDRNGYPNLYTGPTNGGVFPLTNAVWGTGENPLSASHKGVDGRTTKGHVDDYYYSYFSTIDPYYGNWAEHSPKDSLADYMGTNQYRTWLNKDASTHFYFYASGLPMDGYLGTIYSGHRDGAYGMKLFAESRGYNVISDYNQYIYGYDGNTQGFTYKQYKTEIDAGNPVFIQLLGHTMLGVGYSGTDQIIVHDTWDHSMHTMTWGGQYSGRTHYAVTVIHLAPLTAPVTPVAAFTSDVQSGTAPLTVTFTDKSTNTPASWAWNFGDGDSTNATKQNPVHTFASAGTYTVKLTATNAAGSNTVSKTGYILVSAPTTSTITVTSPNGGETFVRGTSLTTTWTYTGNPGSLVRLSLYKDSTYLGYIVTSTSIGTNGKGSYTWPLGLSGSTGSTFKVKIQSTTQSLINDTSNNYFNILSAPTTP